MRGPRTVTATDEVTSSELLFQEDLIVAGLPDNHSFRDIIACHRVVRATFRVADQRARTSFKLQGLNTIDDQMSSTLEPET